MISLHRLLIHVSECRPIRSLLTDFVACKFAVGIVQFGVVTEESLKINLISHSDIGLCVISRL